MKIIAIAAVDLENRIGDSGLMWHLRDDMKFFKTMTTNSVVIMGRKTFETLNCKPLPNRKNIVITSSPEKLHDKVDQYSDIESAIKALKSSLNPDDNIFIIGGASIYEQTKHIWDQVYLTKVETLIEGQLKFPQIDFGMWEISLLRQVERDENNVHPFGIFHYLKLL
jgi:dihydrofolate reductase